MDALPPKVSAAYGTPAARSSRQRRIGREAIGRFVGDPEQAADG
jgi:hypothetical protein